MALQTSRIENLVRQVRNSEYSEGPFVELARMLTSELGVTTTAELMDVTDSLDEAIFGAENEAEAISRVLDLVDYDEDETYTQRYDLNESRKYITKIAADELHERTMIRDTFTKFDEATRASLARDYLAQIDDPTTATYDDYLSWLEHRGVADRAISKVWFNTNKKRHIANLGDSNPASSKPKTMGDLKSTRDPNIPDIESPVRSTPAPKKKASTPKKKSSHKMFTSADQRAVENIITQAGYRLETMWGDDHPVSLRQSKTHNGQDVTVLDAYIRTGDRGPRMDHGGESGDGWMSSAEIEREFTPYGKKWKPRAEALEKRLQKEGYPTAKVSVDYGEKGDIGLNVWIVSKDPLKENFGPLGAPQRGSYEEPEERNELGWTRHPYEDDWGDEADDNIDDMDDEPLF